MNNAQWRYYALNQFLCAKEFDTLPEEAKTVMGEYKHAWSACLENPSKLELDSVTKLFLNLLRVPFYLVCSSNNSKSLFMEHIIATIRDKDLDINKCSQWCNSAINGVELTDVGAPVVKDGLLYYPKNMPPTDLDGKMLFAFKLRCWGNDTPNESLKKLVKLLVSWASPKEAITVSDKDIREIFMLFEKAGVHPHTLSQTALFVSDLQPAFTESNSICWWKNFDQDKICMMLPKGKGDMLVCAVFTVQDFVNATCGDISVLTHMRVRGSRIVIEE